MGDRLPPPGDERALYLLDVMGHVFRAYHALPPLSTSEGQPVHAVLGVVRMIQRLVRERSPAYLAVAMDSKTPTFRDAMYPEYKANRPPPPDDLRAQIPIVRETIEAYAIPVLQREGFEADDLVASTVRKARRSGLHVVVVSSDKDLMQLVEGDGVVLYDTFKGEVFGPDEVRAKWGVGPEALRDLFALMGDSSDNVPGVPGVGPKTAAKLLARFGTLDEVLARASEIEQPKLRETLLANRDRALLSRRLVTLVDDVEVDLDLEALRYGGWDDVKLRALLGRLGFRQILAELGPAGGEGGTSTSTGTSTGTTHGDLGHGTPEIVPRVSDTDTGTETSTSTSTSTGTSTETVLALQRLEEIARETERKGPLGVRAAVVGNRLYGLGLAWKDGAAAYVPLRHRVLGGPTQVGPSEALAVLGPILADPAIEKVGHELKREDVVLRREGIRMEGVSFDSMIASYLLDPERHQHGLDDVASDWLGRALPPAPPTRDADEQAIGEATARFAEEARVTRDLVARLRPEVESVAGGLFHDVELPLSRVLADVEETGILVDVAHLERLSRETGARLASLEKEAHALAGREFNLGSPKQLQRILFDEIGLVPGRKTKTGYSTDSDVLEGLSSEHPLPGKVLEHRMLAKLKGTYLDALPRAVDPDTGRVHTTYSQAVAATGRLSSNDPNLQNIPVRTELGREIRKAFRARDGWVLLSADYSQIELRVLAHLSGDPVLCEAFRAGEDVHDRTAREVFGVPPGEVTKEQRRRAKAINFGVIYGQTEHGLATSLGIPRAEARAFIEAYFARYARLAAYLDEIVAEAKTGEGVRTILGRRRFVRELASKNRNVRMMGERITRNTPIQGSAADIIKVAMIGVSRRLAEERRAARMLLTVHDELVFEVPEEELRAVTALVREEMEGAVALAVPLRVDVGSGPTWADAH